MAISVTFENPQLAVIRTHGTLLRAEVDATKHLVHDHMQAHGKQHVLVLIEDGFTNLEAFVSWDDIEVDHFIQKNIVRLAVVGDLRWRDSALLYLFNSMVPFQIEYFPAAHNVLADAWLTH